MTEVTEHRPNIPQEERVVGASEFDWYEQIADVLKRGFRGSSLQLQKEDLEDSPTQIRIRVQGSENDIARFRAVTRAFEDGRKQNMNDAGLAAVVVSTLNLQRERYPH